MREGRKEGSGSKWTVRWSIMVTMATVAMRVRVSTVSFVVVDGGGGGGGGSGGGGGGRCYREPASHR